MIEGSSRTDAHREVEGALAQELARGNSAIVKIVPVLGHLLGNEDEALFSDETVARVKGMLTHQARELAIAETDAGQQEGAARQVSARILTLYPVLAGQPALLRHCHALALEWQLALRLESERGIDPVLSPLIQALVASDESATASLGMASLTAQARFAQAQRRMELPLGELPADIFNDVMHAWRAQASPATSSAQAAAEERMRAGFDEGNSRLALFDRLVLAMGKGVTAALSVDHAGIATFLSALAFASDQAREDVVASTNARQAVRLALAMRATGLKGSAIEEQLLLLHGNIPPRMDVGAISADRAAALLQNAGGRA